MVGNKADKESKSLNVRLCEEVEGNTLSPTINDTGRKGCKTSKVSSLEQRRTPSIVYNTEERLSSEGLQNLNNGMRNLQSKRSDLDSSCEEIK